MTRFASSRLRVKCPFCRRLPGQACHSRPLGIIYDPDRYVHRARLNRLAEVEGAGG